LAKSSVRIIAGRWRGRRIRVPSVPGLRPTTDRVRETLFSWLAGELSGARCADLCAGSGALGLEALSRGAHHVTFVERDRRALEHIRTTLATLGAEAEASCVRDDALRWILRTKRGEGFGIVFVDPPYASRLASDVLALIASHRLVVPGGLVYLEHGLAQSPRIPEPLEIWRSKRAGQSRFLLLRNPPLPG